MTTVRHTAVVVRTEREAGLGRLMPVGLFDLAHATTAAQEISNAEKHLNGCRVIELDLSDAERIDGTGAVLLARLIERLAAGGRTIRVAAERNRSGEVYRALSRTPR